MILIHVGAIETRLASSRSNLVGGVWGNGQQRGGVALGSRSRRKETLGTHFVPVRIHDECLVAFQNCWLEILLLFVIEVTISRFGG